MQGIGCTVDAFSNETLNAKGHVVLVFGRKSLAVQDEFNDSRADGSGEKAILTNIESMNEEWRVI